MSDNFQIMSSNTLSDLWQKRSIIHKLAVTDLKIRYKSSVLGVLWAFLEPLMILTILFVVFSSLFKNNIENYPVFLLLGIILYQMFSRATVGGMESIIARGGVITSIRIPRVIFPISSSMTALYMMGFEFVIFGGFMIAYRFIPPITALFFPVLLFLLFILSVGIAMPLSVINVHYRDARAIWTIVLQALFFLTPVFYKLTFLPNVVQKVVELSPLAQIIEMSRGVVLDDKLPDPSWFLYVVVITCSIFILGLMLFKKYQKNLVERL